MTKEEGKQVAQKMFARGFTISGWARANGFKRRTVNDVLYEGLGSTMESKKSDEIVTALTRDGFIESFHTN